MQQKYRYITAINKYYHNEQSMVIFIFNIQTINTVREITKHTLFFRNYRIQIMSNVKIKTASAGINKAELFLV
jgi:hypothetical protein